MRTDQAPGLSCVKGRRDLVTGGSGAIISEIVHQLVAAGAARATVLDDFAGGRRSNIASARGTRAPKVLAASSASVDGMAGSFPTTEQHHPHNHDTIYGTAKTFNEGMLARFWSVYGLTYVMLRYVNVYGSRLDVHGKDPEVLLRWVGCIDDGLPPIVFGDGRQPMDLVVVEDIARANLLAEANPITEGVYNVASGTESPLQNPAEALQRVMCSAVPVEHVPESVVNVVGCRFAGTSAPARALGVHAGNGLDEGVPQLAEWRRSPREDVSPDHSHIMAAPASP